MFVGHLALAFAAKRTHPSVSLGWFIAAVAMADLLWPILLLLGLEQVRIVPGATAFTPFVFDAYPWSHSLVMLSVWGVLLAAFARFRGVAQGAAWLLIPLVVSHWVLDFATHAPDMPLWPGSSPRFGLALWNSIPGTLAIESFMWAAALVLYLRDRQPVGRMGAVSLWSLVIVSTVLWAAGPWAAPPPSLQALAWLALIGGWITIPWAAWADRSYRPKPAIIAAGSDG